MSYFSRILKYNHDHDEHGRFASDPGVHPQPDDHGNAVTLKHPHVPYNLDKIEDPQGNVTFTPGVKLPTTYLNGFTLKSMTSDAPSDVKGWNKFAGTKDDDAFNTGFTPTPGKSTGAGVIIAEPDGRIWLTSPSNEYGGYKVTFPKGTVEKGMNLANSAVKEAYEETGLHAFPEKLLGDFDRSTSRARFYVASRVGGSPADMGWESQAVHLVTLDQAKKLLTDPVDQKILNAYIADKNGGTMPEPAKNDGVQSTASAATSGVNQEPKQEAMTFGDDSYPNATAPEAKAYHFAGNYNGKKYSPETKNYVANLAMKLHDPADTGAGFKNKMNDAIDADPDLNPSMKNHLQGEPWSYLHADLKEFTAEPTPPATEDDDAGIKELNVIDAANKGPLLSAVTSKMLPKVDENGVPIGEATVAPSTNLSNTAGKKPGYDDQAVSDEINKQFASKGWMQNGGVFAKVKDGIKSASRAGMTTSPGTLKESVKSYLVDKLFHGTADKANDLDWDKLHAAATGGTVPGPASVDYPIPKGAKADAVVAKGKELLSDVMSQMGYTASGTIAEVAEIADGLKWAPTKKDFVDGALVAITEAKDKGYVSFGAYHTAKLIDFGAVYDAAHKATAASPEPPQSTASTPAPASAASGGMPSFNLTKVGDKQGSNEGGTFEDPYGGKYYVKFYKNFDQGKTEALAAKVYENLGCKTAMPEVAKVNGKDAVMTSWNPNLEKLSLNDYNYLTDQQKEEVGRMYAASILTKNWDVVGDAFDNLAIDKPTGKMLVVDTGGSFKFRAQGEPKPYGSDIDEHESLLDTGKNSGKVFTKIFKTNPQYQKDAMYWVKGLDMNKMKTIFEQSGLSDQAALFKSFTGRRAALLAQYGMAPY